MRYARLASVEIAFTKPGHTEIMNNESKKVKVRMPEPTK